MNTLLAEKKFLEAASVCEAVSKVMEIDVFPGMRFNFFRKRAECKRLAQLHSHELT